MSSRELDLRAIVEVVRNGGLAKIAYLGFSFAIWCSFLSVHMLSLGMGETEIGVVLSTEALAFSASSVLIGYLPDKTGRRPMAISGAALATMSSLAYLWARDLLSVCAVSLGYGAGCSSIFLLNG